MIHELTANDIDEILNESEEVWEVVKEEAERALAANPDDEGAKVRLLQYKQFKRQQIAPNVKNGGLVLAKKKIVRTKATEKTGLWTRTPAGEWAVVCKNAKQGDYVVLKKMNGKTRRVRLLEELAPAGTGYWRI
jgi:predicted ribosome quality control (RQC) complex YloA/Tae2 family protein